MNFIITGPQGSGKGTQARIICKRFGLYYFESGNFLREESKKNKHLEKMLEGGTFVPDAEMSSYVTAYLDAKNLYDDILFDGFPRSIKQYRAFKPWLLDKNVSLDLVIVLVISDKESIRRLSARRMDISTGKIYNLITNPPPKDIDKSTLFQRTDDKPEAIKKRLGWYRSLVVPLIEELKKEITVFEVDGERSIKKITEELVQIIEKRKKIENAK